MRRIETDDVVVNKKAPTQSLQAQVSQMLIAKNDEMLIAKNDVMLPQTSISGAANLSDSIATKPAINLTSAATVLVGVRQELNDFLKKLMTRIEQTSVDLPTNINQAISKIANAVSQATSSLGYVTAIAQQFGGSAAGAAATVGQPASITTEQAQLIQQTGNLDIVGNAFNNVVDAVNTATQSLGEQLPAQVEEQLIGMLKSMVRAGHAIGSIVDAIRAAGNKGIMGQNGSISSEFDNYLGKALDGVITGEQIPETMVTAQSWQDMSTLWGLMPEQDPFAVNTVPSLAQNVFGTANIPSATSQSTGDILTLLDDMPGVAGGDPAARHGDGNGFAGNGGLDHSFAFGPGDIGKGDEHGGRAEGMGQFSEAERPNEGESYSAGGMSAESDMEPGNPFGHELANENDPFNPSGQGTANGNGQINNGIGSASSGLGLPANQTAGNGTNSTGSLGSSSTPIGSSGSIGSSSNGSSLGSSQPTSSSISPSLLASLLSNLYDPTLSGVETLPNYDVSIGTLNGSNDGMADSGNIYLDYLGNLSSPPFSIGNTTGNTGADLFSSMGTSLSNLTGNIFDSTLSMADNMIGSALNSMGSSLSNITNSLSGSDLSSASSLSGNTGIGGSTLSGLTGSLSSMADNMIGSALNSMDSSLSNITNSLSGNSSSSAFSLSGNTGIGDTLSGLTGALSSMADNTAGNIFDSGNLISGVSGGINSGSNNNINVSISGNDTIASANSYSLQITNGDVLEKINGIPTENSTSTDTSSDLANSIGSILTNTTSSLGNLINNTADPIVLANTANEQPTSIFDPLANKPMPSAIGAGDLVYSPPVEAAAVTDSQDLIDSSNSQIVSGGSTLSGVSPGSLAYLNYTGLTAAPTFGLNVMKNPQTVTLFGVSPGGGIGG